MTGAVFCPSWRAILPKYWAQFANGEKSRTRPWSMRWFCTSGATKESNVHVVPIQVFLSKSFSEERVFQAFFTRFWEILNKTTNATELQTIIQQNSRSAWIWWLKSWYWETQQCRGVLWAGDVYYCLSAVFLISWTVVFLISAHHICHKRYGSAVLKENGLIWASAAHHCLSVHLTSYAGVASFSERLPTRPIAITWRF